jgi:hypothetical protein
MLSTGVFCHKLGQKSREKGQKSAQGSADGTNISMHAGGER